MPLLLRTSYYSILSLNCKEQKRVLLEISFNFFQPEGKTVSCDKEEKTAKIRKSLTNRER
jgi:hypothetical protein